MSYFEYLGVCHNLKDSPMPLFEFETYPHLYAVPHEKEAD